MIIATVLLALAAAVAVGTPPAARLARIASVTQPREGRRRVWLLLAAVVALAIGVATGHPGWSAAAATATGTGAWLLVRVRSTRRRADAHRQTTRAASSLALLLRTGMIPGAALQEAALICDALKPAAAAHALGAEVSAALHEVGRRPGYEGFSTMASAWQVSARTGAPVAPVLARVAETLRQEQQVRAVIDAELAAARVSSRIMALLPFVALLLGTVMGADPMAFMGSHWVGEVLILAGVALCVAGMVWTERLAQAVTA